MLKKRSRSNLPKSEINVTPLVDVMLVLLIIFMVSAPMMNSSIFVRLPTGNKGNPAAVENAVDISLNQFGQIFIKEKFCSIDNLILEFSRMPIGPETKINIRADEKLSYGAVVSVMNILASNGFKHISLVTKPCP